MPPFIHGFGKTSGHAIWVTVVEVDDRVVEIDVVEVWDVEVLDLEVVINVVVVEDEVEVEVNVNVTDDVVVDEAIDEINIIWIAPFKVLILQNTPFNKKEKQY